MGVKLTDGEIGKMIEEIDEDKDGFISWQEFKKVMLE